MTTVNDLTPATPELYARLMGTLHPDGRPDFVHRLEWMRDVMLILGAKGGLPMRSPERDAQPFAYTQGATPEHFVDCCLQVRKLSLAEAK